VLQSDAAELDESEGFEDSDDAEVPEEVELTISALLEGLQDKVRL
jgi:hypothetical protein